MQLARRLGGDHLYDCTTCEQQPSYLEYLGHDGPPVGGWWDANLVTDAPLTLCPRRMMLLAQPDRVEEALRYAHEYFPAYRDGHLLAAGGLGDQPARYVSLIQLTRRLDNAATAKWFELQKEDDE